MTRLRTGNKRAKDKQGGKLSPSESRKYWKLKDKQWWRHANEAFAHIAEHPYVEDCRYHPCRVTKFEKDDWRNDIDVECESMVNGTSSACSYNHCGLDFLTKEEAHQRADFIRRYGMWAYQFRYVYQAKPNEHDKVVDALRELNEMEAVWGFAKNGAVDTLTDLGKAFMLHAYGVNVDSVLNKQLDA